MSAWLEFLRRRRLPILGAAVVFGLTAWVLWSLFAPHRDPRIEAIRKRGYPVTLAELVAWYPPVPDEENAALIYTNALELLVRSWSTNLDFLERNWQPPIGQGLSAEQKRRLRVGLSEEQAALRLLYSVPASSRSRYPVRLEDGIPADEPQETDMSLAVSLLRAEALLHATEGDAEKSTQAFLAAGALIDSVGDGPLPHCHWQRYYWWRTLLSRLELALSLTAFTDGQLVSLQQRVQSAERPGAALRGWAGAQAWGLEAFADPKLVPTVLLGVPSRRNEPQPLQFKAFLSFYAVVGLLHKDKAIYCDMMGRHLAALELPYPARFAACQQLVAPTNTPSHLYFYSARLLPGLERVYVMDANHTALVRVAASALAIERFRLAHTNTLPQGLEQLSPAWCPTAPIDPIDGAPLRYKTRGASYAVYSIGSDGSDQGGVVWNSNSLKVPSDVSFVVKH